MNPVPWQLYIFCLLNLAGGILCCWGTFVCGWIFGKCHAGVEEIVLRVFALSMLYVGVLFSVLTYTNHGNAAKLKRLAIFATDSTIAMLVAVIMTGPKHLGGVEKGWAHLGDMIGVFVLLIIMLTAVMDDTEVAGCSPVHRGLGINPKTFLWLCLIWGVVKLFMLSDFMTYHYIIEDADASSNLARVLWNFCAVFVLMVLFVLFFAIGYGGYKDQEMTVITIAVLSIVSVLGTINVNTAGIFRQMIIKAVVTIVVAGIAVWGGRREGRGSSGYEAVGNV